MTLQDLENLMERIDDITFSIQQLRHKVGLLAHVEGMDVQSDMAHVGTILTKATDETEHAWSVLDEVMRAAKKAAGVR